MSDTTRIEQFRKMANDDPDNELGHFSLGRALLEGGRRDEAIAAFRRVIELNPNISKAYQLLAQAQLDGGARDDAVATLTAGVRTAHARGDLMPRNEMSQLLKTLGADVPDVVGGGAGTAPQPSVGAGQVLCKRCGKAGPKLERPPFRSEFGKEIYDNVCQACWREAIGMGTKVINELRLPLADPQAQRVWDQHIREFLNL